MPPTLPSLWQPKGQTLGLPAQAHGKRFNVIGFWPDGDGRFVYRGKTGRMSATDFITTVEENFLPTLQRPTVVVLDNGSLHRARAVKARKAEWRR